MAALPLRPKGVDVNLPPKPTRRDRRTAGPADRGRIQRRTVALRQQAAVTRSRRCRKPGADIFEHAATRRCSSSATRSFHYGDIIEVIDAAGRRRREGRHCHRRHAPAASSRRQLVRSVRYGVLSSNCNGLFLAPLASRPWPSAGQETADRVSKPAACCRRAERRSSLSRRRAGGAGLLLVEFLGAVA